MSRFGFLSTFPPTRCGLATFTEALSSALVHGSADQAVIVRVDDLVPAGPAPSRRAVNVASWLHPSDLGSRASAVATLNECDAVIIQHEFGIYGGPDGEEVIGVLESLQPRRIVVLHTVLARPTAHQRLVLQRIVQLADVIVVMTSAAYTIVSEQYGADRERLELIPHGVEPRPIPRVRWPADRPVILTWGLIGPGKGVEWGIRALGGMPPRVRPLYRVLGQTHPKVLLDQGEQYRSMLESLVAQLGLSRDVEIDGRYQTSEELATQLELADLVLLPYDSTDQATSGVLAEAVAAGKVVVATRFPHAVELLSAGGGILVANKRPDEIARAIRDGLHNPRFGVRARMQAVERASTNGWPRVAARFRALAVGASVVGRQ